jgi:hypothetical protein
VGCGIGASRIGDGKRQASRSLLVFLRYYNRKGIASF